MRAAVVAAGLVAALALAGCGNNVACKKGTLFLTIDFSGDALAADHIDVDVSIGGGAPRSGGFAHKPGEASGSIEVDFSSYPSGSVTVAARASSGGTIIAATTQDVTLTSGCTAAHVALGSGGLADLGGGGAVLSADRMSIDYGSVVANTVSAPVSVTVRNDGTDASGSLTALLSGADASSFVISSDTCTSQTLAPGATCVVAVKLQPASAGTPMATLTVGMPDGSISVSLTGTVLAAGALVFIPTSNDFMTVTVGTNANFTFTLKNTGGSPTGALTTASFSGSDANQFSLGSDSCSGMTLAANATCTINVVFTPTSGGGKIASLSISGNPGGGAAASVSGTGRIARTLTVNVAQIDGSMGTVSSNPAGINACGAAGCSAQYTDGQMIMLTAAPAPGFYFQGWTGDCSGTSLTCTVAMTAARTVGGTFTPPNHVFITSTQYTLTSLAGATLSNLPAAADTACANAASGKYLGTYVAWVSKTGTPALGKLGSARGWVRYDGKPVFDTTAKMAQKQMFYPVIYDENGTSAPAGNTYVLTGTLDDGSTNPDNCANWTDRGSGDLFIIGLARGNVSWWTDSNYAGDCDTDSNMFRLYCMGTKYNAPITYAPATGRLAFVSKGAFNTSTGFAGAQTICTNEAAANAKTMGHTFVPLLARPTASAASNFNAAGMPWVRVDGIPIVAAGSDLIGATPNLISSIGVTADGTYYGDYAWTGGNNPTTTSNAQTCSDWTVNTSGGSGMSGAVGFTDLGYFAHQTFNCTPPAYRVYCLEQ